MATRSLKSTILRVRQWAQATAGGDDELLRRFTRSRDEAAFAELVARHGTLVLGVARRVLGAAAAVAAPPPARLGWLRGGLVPRVPCTVPGGPCRGRAAFTPAVC